MNENKTASKNACVEEQETSREDKESRCVVCMHPIISGAKKCTKCNSYQNAFISILSGLDIKSLVALVPVVTLAFVFVQDQLITYKSELKIAPLECGIDTIKIATANVGNKDALFAGVKLMNSDSTNNTDFVNMRFSTGAESKLVIEPGKVKVYEMKAFDSTGGSLGLNLTTSNPCQYYIIPRSVNFTEVSTLSEKVCACPQI